MLRKFFGENCYIVGGCIRDLLLLKNNITDIDIVCISDEKDFKKILEKLNKEFPLFPLDRERGIWRAAVGENLTIDISRADSLYDDIKRRDFTLNSLAVNIKHSSLKINKNFFDIKLKKNEIIDLTGGIEDIKKKIIRVVSKDVFDEDPLRMLRAVRFSCQLLFNIRTADLKLIKIKKNLIKKVSAERIKEELVKMASSDDFYKAVKTMIKTEILFEIFPELEKQKGCAQVYYGKDGVIKHTLNVIEKLDMFFKQPLKYSSLPLNLIDSVCKEKYLIKIAGLFHDIAKPHTAAVRGDRLRFFGHEYEGARMTEEYLRYFKFSNKEIKYISSIIRHHLRIGSIAVNDPLTKRAAVRVFYDMKEYTVGLLILSWADYASHIKNSKFLTLIEKTKQFPQPLKKKLSHKGTLKTVRFIQVVNFLMKNYFDFYRTSDVKPLLDGNEIMKILSIEPSPAVGKIKKRLISLQLEGKIVSKKDAVNYIKSLAKNLSF